MISAAASTRGSVRDVSFQGAVARHDKCLGLCTLRGFAKHLLLWRRWRQPPPPPPRVLRCCYASSTPESLKEPRKNQKRILESINKDSDSDIATLGFSSAQCVTAPLVSALRTSAQQDVACFHFPGHNRGKASPASLSRLVGFGPFIHDLPELPELDDLFSPKGVILEAQKRASELFGSSETWFLVGGTTCGIQASIMATCSPGETLILPRNSHISATSAMVLSGAIPKYIIPEYNSQWDIASGVTASQVEGAINDLAEDGKRAAAVLVTSPTYHGICSKLSEITEVCHTHGIPVIVDEAHGAHFKFHKGFPSTALEQGADLTVQSTHKVLCSLTQSSMLHMSGNLVDTGRIRRCLQTLQSSSPSYLLLASLDAARAQLDENPGTIFDDAMDLAIEARNQIKGLPSFSVLCASSNLFPSSPAIDPLRLTVNVSNLGLSGYEVDHILADERQIISELAGTRTVTFAINLGTRRKDVQRLASGLKHLSAATFQGNRLHSSAEASKSAAPFAGIHMNLSPREAFFAKKRKMDILRSTGEVCGELICPYPPGIPVLIPGEIITEEAVNYLLDLRKKGAVITGAADHQLSSLTVCDR